MEISGVVTAVKSPLIIAELYGGAVGSFVKVNSSLTAKIVAFDGEKCSLFPLGTLERISVGDSVKLISTASTIKIPRNPLGCVIDAEGQVLFTTFATPLDTVPLRCFRTAPKPLDRSSSFEWFQTGVTTIDALLPMWTGQRLAVLAEPGLGKTSLLRSLAGRNPQSPTVVALIGERGIEVNQFVHELRADGGLENTVVVVSTSDEPPLKRSFAAFTAVAIAEYLATQNQPVQLLFDSITRFARALRDVGLASGEPAVRRGYPASVFRQLPELIERTGPLAVGSITAFFTVLTAGTIDEDPITEEICSLTDGHLVLSRSLAEAGIFPAIDVVSSLSRNSERVISIEDQQILRELRTAFSHASTEEDLMRMGGQPLYETTLRVLEHRSHLHELLRGNVTSHPSEIRRQIHALIFGT